MQPSRTRLAVANRVVCLLAALILSGIAGAAFAIEAAALYTAEVPLDPEEADPRAAAYETALAEVLLRVSGSALSSDPDRIAAIFPNPAAYVMQFRRGADDTLWVSFDGEAIEETLRLNGQRVWGSERPLTLVWLAVDWGQGEREIIGADDPEHGVDDAFKVERNRLLRQRVLDVAERRGLPVVFPLLDTEDLTRVSFSDIWGGFDEQVLAASARYEADSVLIGRIRPATGQRNRWSYFFANEERSWTGEPELVVNLIADRLSAEFAIGGAAAPVAVALRVAGITSVEAYGSVQRLLSNMSVVERFTIVAVAGDRVSYRIEAHGGVDRLARALRLAGLLEVERFDGSGFETSGETIGDSIGDTLGQSLEFFYSP